MNIALAFFYSKDLFIDVCRHIPQFLQSSGSFDEINKEERDIPLGSWAGTFGELVNYRMVSFIFENEKLFNASESNEL